MTLEMNSRSVDECTTGYTCVLCMRVCVFVFIFCDGDKILLKLGYLNCFGAWVQCVYGLCQGFAIFHWNSFAF